MTSRSSRGSAQSFDSSRRTFRGRAGPTDGRLNKHQARRRKYTTHDDDVKVNKYGDDGKKDAEIVEEKNKQEDVDESEEISSNEAQQVVEVVETSSPADKEIQHLMRRVKNVRESIQVSAAANANPSTWQQNVLNPVGNCVGEWRAIVSHYQNVLESSDCKAPSLAVFELLQMALQSGPLAGAKPGYFKRCGSDVATQALKFLDSNVPDKEEAAFLQFSEKQTEAIDKWRNSASKATESDKPPSKSAVKKQSKAKKKK